MNQEEQLKQLEQLQRQRTSTAIITAIHLPREADAEQGRSNALFGLALFAVFLVLFAGTIGVALVYLALD